MKDNTNPDDHDVYVQLEFRGSLEAGMKKLVFGIESYWSLIKKIWSERVGSFPPLFFYFNLMVFSVNKTRIKLKLIVSKQ